MSPNVALIGFGMMGSGIAQVFATKGFQVSLYDQSSGAVRTGLERIKTAFSNPQHESAAQTSDILGMLKVKDSIAETCADADIAVECVFENPRTKIEVLREIEKSVPNKTIITTNASAISISYLQKSLARSDRFAGFHWSTPPTIRELIEIVKGKYTSEQTVDKLVRLAASLGKQSIVVRRDVRGFVANRVNWALRYQAYILYLRGVYDYQAIDSALIHRLGLPLGTFARADYTGSLRIWDDESKMYDEVKNAIPDYEPSAGYEKAYREAFKLVKRMIAANRLGVRTGRGFYEYPKPGEWVMPAIPENLGENVNLTDLLAPAINHAFFIVRNGIATAKDVDKALRLGIDWPKGLFQIFEEQLTKDQVIIALRNLKSTLPNLAEFYEPDEGLLRWAS